jgi:hypothetical protein
LRFSGSDLLTEFAFSDEYLQLMAETRTEAGKKTPLETPMKAPMKTEEAILSLLTAQPTLTLSEAASVLEKSSSAVYTAYRLSFEVDQFMGSRP